jgi:hypothetical protein
MPSFRFAPTTDEQGPLDAGHLGFHDWCSAYENTARVNEQVFASFTRLTDSIPWLKAHRDWVEANAFGYGQRAFHYLWYLLLPSLGAAFWPVSMLEIGVYKGQIISLAALVARELGFEMDITAISPFAGNQPSIAPWRAAYRFVFRPTWRKEYLLGNLHPAGDYLADNRRMFDGFGLDFGRVHAVRGLSTSPDVVARVKGRAFAVIFIDGDHSYEVARSDIETYAPLVAPGGLVVVDDGASFLPGRGYFKGMKTVSMACRILEQSSEWQNVLNVGHNRVFRRTGSVAR